LLLGPILILLTLAGCGLFYFRPVWFPLPITAEALVFDRQFNWTLWVAGAIFVAVQVVLAWAIARGLRKTSAQGTRVGHRWLEIGWTVATAALFLTLSLTGSRGWAKTPVRSRSTETIEVYSHQFAWNFRYPGIDGRFGVTGAAFINDAAGNPIGIDPADKAGRDDVTTASLRIPAGRDVLLLLHSRDVIHDFFVRELRTKQDIIPGMEIPLEIHVDKPGQYEIACAELCGLGHSQMRSLLIVMAPAEYDRWKREKSEESLRTPR
jgi:cytochrome c oxidase subunit 2